MSVTPQSIEAAIDAMLAPLREQLAAIDDELADIDTRRAELNDIRKRVNRLISANSRNGKPGPKPKPATTTKRKYIGVRPELIDYVLDYVTKRGGEFSAPQLLDDEDFEWELADTALNKALGALHERGAIRLVRSGGIEGYGGRTKVWEVTRRG